MHHPIGKLHNYLIPGPEKTCETLQNGPMPHVSIEPNRNPRGTIGGQGG